MHAFHPFKISDRLWHISSHSSLVYTVIVVVNCRTFYQMCYAGVLIFSFIILLQKFTNEREVLVRAKASEVSLGLDPPVTSHLTPNTIGRNVGRLESENKEATDSSHDGGNVLPGNQEIDETGSTPQDAPHDPEKIRLEQAATKAQAAFRGYLVILSLILIVKHFFNTCLGTSFAEHFVRLRSRFQMLSCS